MEENMGLADVTIRQVGTRKGNHTQLALLHYFRLVNYCKLSQVIHSLLVHIKRELDSHPSFCKNSTMATMPEHITTVNIPDMDEQHKELFSAVIALKDSSSCIEERLETSPKMALLLIGKIWKKDQPWGVLKVLNP